MSDEFIPLSEPSLGGNAEKYLRECLRTNYVSSVGPFVSRFEKGFAEYVGAKHAVACSSGTAALHVAFRVLGVQPGDEVLVPSLTFVASANAAAYLGARVTFVDSEAETWTMDAALVVDEIARRDRTGLPQPAAIEVVHLLGHPAAIETLRERAGESGIPLIEDAAEALGASYASGALSGRLVGTVGRLGCFSFNGNKVMTTGGGGMLVTDEYESALHARHLSNQSRLPGLAYDHDEIGYNYRLTNLAAALGVAQLERLSGFLDRKRAIAARYDEAFTGSIAIKPAPRADWAHPSFWLYSVRLPDSTRTAALLDALNARGIGARPMWTPLHSMVPYRDSDIIGSGSVAETIAATTISLPSSVGLADDEQSRVIDAVLAAVGEARG